MTNKEPFLDPQKQLLLEKYCSPKSDTFGNAYKSALAAGYTDSYAKNIMHIMPDWLSEGVGDMKRLRKAERLMDNIMELPAVDEEGRVDNSLISNQIKVIGIVAKGPGKAKYSERTEVTGRDGGAIQYENLNELSDAELARLITEGKSGDGEEGDGEASS